MLSCYIVFVSEVGELHLKELPDDSSITASFVKNEVVLQVEAFP